MVLRFAVGQKSLLKDSGRNPLASTYHGACFQAFDDPGNKLIEDHLRCNAEILPFLTFSRPSPDGWANVEFDHSSIQRSTYGRANIYFMIYPIGSPLTQLY